MVVARSDRWESAQLGEKVPLVFAKNPGALPTGFK